MNDVFDLFKGVGVIIDDALANVNSKDKDIIWKIKESFDEKNIPILTCSELPSNEILANFNSVSFLLLDWDLYGTQLELGVSKPQTATDDNIDFIKQFNSICFAPIFIFSNENIDDIKNKLAQENLYDVAKSNHIFVESKSALHDACSLFSKIKTWIETTPSIYVMKEWEKSLNKAKRDLFWDFYTVSPNWVKIFYDTTVNDNTNLSYEMSELLFENLKTRCIPIVFDNNIISSQNLDTTTIPSEELNQEMKQVLEGQRFIKKEHTIDNMIFTGDIFFIKDKYYINVRPQCDCIPREQNQTIDDVNIYLIEGEEKDLSKLNFSKKFGIFSDTETRFTIFPVCGSIAIQFDLGEFSIEKYSCIKEYRIGTLLSPFITRLIQKYAFYMQRQGLPRIPNEAVQ
jgi:hypothetical protein